MPDPPTLKANPKRKKHEKKVSYKVISLYSFVSIKKRSENPT